MTDQLEAALETARQNVLGWVVDAGHTDRSERFNANVNHLIAAARADAEARCRRFVESLMFELSHNGVDRTLNLIREESAALADPPEQEAPRG